MKRQDIQVMIGFVLLAGVFWSCGFLAGIVWLMVQGGGFG